MAAALKGHFTKAAQQESFYIYYMSSCYAKINEIVLLKINKIVLLSLVYFMIDVIDGFSSGKICGPFRN